MSYQQSFKKIDLNNNHYCRKCFEDYVKVTYQNIYDENQYLCESCFDSLPVLRLEDFEDDETEVDEIFHFGRTFRCDKKRGPDCCLCQESLCDEVLNTEWGRKDFYHGHKSLNRQNVICHNCYSNKFLKK